MKFETIINKNINFYFFVQNLSEWHFSAKKDYNEFWKKETGELSEEEIESLNSFKEIRSKYHSSKTIFELAFCVEEPFEYLKDQLKNDDFIEVNKTFDVFKKRFEKIYKKELPFLREWQIELDKTLDNQEKLDKIVSDLATLYGVKETNKKILIYLLFSSPNHTGGGANIDDKSISVELSRCPLKEINHILGIIWHETTHLCFDKVNFHPMLREIFKEKEDKWFIIKELTASSLFPKGILAHKYFGIEISKDLHSQVSSEYSLQTLDLVNNYLKQGKTLDKEYIKKIANIIDSQIKSPA